MVKIGLVTLMEKSLEIVDNWTQYDDRRSFDTLAFENVLKYRNFDFSRLIDNYFCIHCAKIW